MLFCNTADILPQPFADLRGKNARTILGAEDKMDMCCYVTIWHPAIYNDGLAPMVKTMGNASFSPPDVESHPLQNVASIRFSG